MEWLPWIFWHSLPWLAVSTPIYLTGAWVMAYWTGRKRIGSKKRKAEEDEWGWWVIFWPIVVLWKILTIAALIPLAPFYGAYKFITWGHSLGESRAEELPLPPKPVRGEVILPTDDTNPYPPNSIEHNLWEQATVRRHYRK